MQLGVKNGFPGIEPCKRQLLNCTGWLLDEALPELPILEAHTGS